MHKEFLAETIPTDTGIADWSKCSLTNWKNLKCTRPSGGPSAQCSLQTFGNKKFQSY